MNSKFAMALAAGAGLLCAPLAASAQTSTLHVYGPGGKPGLRVVVVQGAGRTGMWEDIAGRLGNLQTIAALRSNIVSFAPNSAVAQVVPIEAENAIWRDAGLALTRRGEANPLARQFFAFVGSSEGAAIFKKWGWSP